MSKKLILMSPGVSDRGELADVGETHVRLVARQLATEEHFPYIVIHSPHITAVDSATAVVEAFRRAGHTVTDVREESLLSEGQHKIHELVRALKCASDVMFIAHQSCIVEAMKSIDPAYETGFSHAVVLENIKGDWTRPFNGNTYAVVEEFTPA